MKSKKLCLLIVTVQTFILGFSSVAQQVQKKDYTSYVNPFIGTQNHGHVFLGANVPAGFVQLGPSNIMQTWDKFNGWDWCSGYNYISNEILGFTHTHLSGTGIGDLNDILILPATDSLHVHKASFQNFTNGYGSPFSRANEKCRPGYYKVYLDRYKVRAELTTTERVGFHKYHFEKSDNAHVLVDLSFGMGWDAVTDSYFEQVDDSTFLGYRYSKGWANDQRLFFAIRLSQPVTAVELFDSSRALHTKAGRGKYIKAALFFDAMNHPEIKLKVALSPVSSSNALMNMQQELPGWKFDETVQLAKKKWNDVLSRIAIEAADEVKIKFYTALYHSLFFPSLYNDVDGTYRGADQQVYKATDRSNYTVFSLWDTYRGLHPLMTLIQPERVNDYIRTMLDIYKQQGKLPVWHLEGNETNTMIGYPAVPVIAEAFLKGYRDYDVSLAYEAVKHSAMQNSDGINFIQQLKFIPADSVNESVAKALEYAYADWCIAQMAKALNKMDDYKYFSARANLYQLYFDQSIGFVRGRVSADAWRTPFNPVSALHRGNDYCEGNAWQYTWLVPHDVPGLIRLFGGEKNFTRKLDSLFSVSSVLDEHASPDISGMVGQYAHGNEPNHHIPFLYMYAGQPWKTAAMTRLLADTFYTTRPDGLCGNDDVGELSTWYIFNALGFYPVNPGSGEYVFGSPLINSAIIRNGKKEFRIRVVDNSKRNIFIQRMELNGKSFNQAYINHRDIAKGGEIVIYMGALPNKKWATSKAGRPH